MARGSATLQVSVATALVKPDIAEMIQLINDNPESPFVATMGEMLKLHLAKSADYAGEEHPYQNFYDSAEQVSDTAGQSCEVIIGTKQARLKTLLRQMRNNTGKPKNEPIRDSLIDRAVFSVIGVGLYDMGGYDLTIEETD